MRILSVIVIAVCCLGLSALSYSGNYPVNQEEFITERATPGLLLPISFQHSDIERYPHIVKMLLKGAKMWQDKVPIHFKLEAVMDPTQRVPGGHIKIIIGDLRKMGFVMPGGLYLGLWDHRNRILYIEERLETWEADRAEMIRDGKLDAPVSTSAMDNEALHTIVHELGHVLGLPHITGMKTKKGVPAYPHGQAGNVVVESDDKAREYVMYPHAGSTATEISQLEVDLVMERNQIPEAWRR